MEHQLKKDVTPIVKNMTQRKHLSPPQTIQP